MKLPCIVNNKKFEIGGIQMTFLFSGKTRKFICDKLLHILEILYKQEVK